MSTQEQRRKAFEANYQYDTSGWAEFDSYMNSYKAYGEITTALAMINIRWECWNAALDSVCITLPDCTEELPDTQYGVSLCREAIHAAGVKTK